MSSDMVLPVANNYVLLFKTFLNVSQFGKHCYCSIAVPLERL